jgi:hypothetical protein
MSLVVVVVGTRLSWLLAATQSSTLPSLTLYIHPFFLTYFFFFQGVDYSNWGEMDCGDRMCKTHDLYGQSTWVNVTNRVFVDT